MEKFPDCNESALDDLSEDALYGILEEYADVANEHWLNEQGTNFYISTDAVVSAMTSPPVF